MRIASAIALLLLAIPALAAGPDPLPAGMMLRGHFVQLRVLAGFTRPLRTEGHFVLVGGQGLIWSSDLPFKTSTIITAAGILQQADGQEALRLPSAKLPALGRFYTILSGALGGNLGGIGQDFTLTDAPAPAGGFHWQLTPLHPDDPVLGQIRRIEISGQPLVEHVTIEKTSGDVDQIAFSEQSQSPVALDPAESAAFASAAQPGPPK